MKSSQVILAELTQLFARNDIITEKWFRENICYDNSIRQHGDIYFEWCGNGVAVDLLHNGGLPIGTIQLFQTQGKLLAFCYSMNILVPLLTE